MSIKRFLTVALTSGLMTIPVAVSAQTATGGTQGSTTGIPSAPSQQGPTYGSSRQTVGTVTAPSVGSYNRPSVGVTNSVPTWSNTNPPAK